MLPALSDTCTQKRCCKRPLVQFYVQFAESQSCIYKSNNVSKQFLETSRLEENSVDNIVMCSMSLPILIAIAKCVYLKFCRIRVYTSVTHWQLDDGEWRIC